MRRARQGDRRAAGAELDRCATKLERPCQRGICACIVLVLIFNLVAEVCRTHARAHCCQDVCSLVLLRAFTV